MSRFTPSSADTTTRPPQPRDARGVRIMRRMARQLLEGRLLQAAIGLDPHMRMTGQRHYKLRTGLGLLKIFLRGWLWCQAMGNTPMPPANPMPPNKTRKPVVRMSAPITTANAAIEAATPPSSIPEFRPRVPLFKRPKAAHPEAAEKPNPNNTIRIIEVRPLPEVHLFLFGCLPPRPLKVWSPQFTPQPKRGRLHPKAGQIQADLQKITAILEAPERAITKVAGKIAKLGFTTQPAAQAQDTPWVENHPQHLKPKRKNTTRPNAQSIARLNLGEDVARWWQGISLQMQPQPPP